MSIHVALNHVTHYRYDRPVTLGPQVVRLRPAPHCRTPILSYSLQVEPAKHFINWQQDPFGNYLARLVFPEKTREFTIEVDLVAEMTVYQPVRLLPRAERREVPVRLRARSWRPSSRRTCVKAPRDAAASPRSLASIDRARRGDDRLPGRR